MPQDAVRLLTLTSATSGAPVKNISTSRPGHQFSRLPAVGQSVSSVGYVYVVYSISTTILNLSAFPFTSDDGPDRSHSTSRLSRRQLPAPSNTAPSEMCLTRVVLPPVPPDLGEFALPLSVAQELARDPRAGFRETCLQQVVRDPALRLVAAPTVEPHGGIAAYWTALANAPNELIVGGFRDSRLLAGLGSALRVRQLFVLAFELACALGSPHKLPCGPANRPTRVWWSLHGQIHC